MERFDWILLAGAAVAVYVAYRTREKSLRKHVTSNFQHEDNAPVMQREWYEPFLPIHSGGGEGGGGTSHKGSGAASSSSSRRIQSAAIPRDHLRDPSAGVRRKGPAVTVGSEYTDLQLVINNIHPHPLFNLSNLPVTTRGAGENRDVYPYANKLANKLGKQAEMGLRIVDIKNIKRTTTETQTLFRYDLVLHRDTPVPAQEMAILRIEMVMDYSQSPDEKFFDDYMLTKEPTPKLQNIQLLNTVHDYQDVGSEALTQHYAITHEDEEADFTSEADIQRTLRKVRDQHNDENGRHNVLLDENGDEVFNEGWSSQQSSKKYGDLDEVCSGIGTKSVARRLRENMSTPEGVTGVGMYS